MFAVGKAFEKHKMVLETKGASNIGILLGKLTLFTIRAID